MSDVILDYRILEPVARGPLGVVWRAEPVGRNRISVAVTFLDDGPDVDAVVDALRERIARSDGLRHPFVARDLAVQPVEGRMALVTEQVEGVTLAPVLSRGPLPVGVACEVLRKVVRALHAAWDRVPAGGDAPFGLLHGDLTPETIWLGRGGQVKVTGFGQDPADAGEPRDAARARLPFPTPWTAPEAHSGSVQHASDVYAMGALLAQMLTGVVPAHASPQQDWHEAAMATVAEKVREVTGDSALAELMMYCLAFDPGRRPSAREVEGWLDGARRRHRRPRLPAWCDKAVPELRLAAREELALTEALDADSSPPRRRVAAGAPTDAPVDDPDDEATHMVAPASTPPTPVPAPDAAFADAPTAHDEPLDQTGFQLQDEDPEAATEAIDLRAAAEVVPAIQPPVVRARRAPQVLPSEEEWEEDTASVAPVALAVSDHDGAPAAEPAAFGLDDLAGPGPEPEPGPETEPGPEHEDAPVAAEGPSGWAIIQEDDPIRARGGDAPVDLDAVAFVSPSARGEWGGLGEESDDTPSVDETSWIDATARRAGVDLSARAEGPAWDAPVSFNRQEEDAGEAPPRDGEPAPPDDAWRPPLRVVGGRAPAGPRVSGPEERDTGFLYVTADAPPAVAPPAPSRPRVEPPDFRKGIRDKAEDGPRRSGAVYVGLGLVAAVVLLLWAPWRSDAPTPSDEALTAEPTAPATRPVAPVVEAPATDPADAPEALDADPEAALEAPLSTPSTPSTVAPAAAPPPTPAARVTPASKLPPPSTAPAATKPPPPTPAARVTPATKTLPPPTAPPAATKPAPPSVATPVAPVAPPKPPPEPKPAPVKASAPPAPSPAPADAPAEAAPAAPAAGRLSVGGDAASVTLVGAGGSFGAGEVPAGTYTLMVAFEAGTAAAPQGSVTVGDGGRVTVTCKASFLRCRVD